MKSKLIIALVAGLFVLGGCSQGDQSSSHSSSQSSSSSQKMSKSSAKSSRTSSQASSSSKTSESSTAASASSSKPSQPAPEKNDASRLQTLNATLTKAIGTNKVPTADGLGAGSDKLNMRYSPNAYGYTVYYSVGNTTKDFNAGDVANETPYATFSKTSYASAAGAAQAVQHRDLQNGLPTVDLGSGVSGQVDHGAGQAYLTWEAGRWSVTVHATSVTGESPDAMGKQLVSLFDQYALPVPNQVGAARFEVSAGGLDQVITWQDGNTLYTVSARSADTAVKMASSLK